MAARLEQALQLLLVCTDHMLRTKRGQPAAAGAQHAAAGAQAGDCDEAAGLQHQRGGAAADAPAGRKRALQLQAGLNGHMLQLAGQILWAGGERAGHRRQQHVYNSRHMGSAAA